MPVAKGAARTCRGCGLAVPCYYREAGCWIDHSRRQRARVERIEALARQLGVTFAEAQMADDQPDRFERKRRAKTKKEIAA